MKIPSMFQDALVGEATASDADADEQHVGFIVERQKGARLCWAAVSVSLRSFASPESPAIEQCRLAELVLPGNPECCGGGDALPDDCDAAALLSDGLSAVNVAATETGEPMPFFDVRPEIRDRHVPVACRIDFASPNLPHFVVIEGYLDRSDGTTDYFVSDPQRGSLKMPVPVFETDYNHEGGHWSSSFLLV